MYPMVSVATSIEKNGKPAHFMPPKPPKLISWEDFGRRYLAREDGNKYEWLNGTVEKSGSTDYTQFFIVKNLMDCFIRLKNSINLEGYLIPEGDIFFGQHHRRPDVAYVTDEQSAHTAYGENQVPGFVIEVISKKDQMDLVHKKMDDYRNAGVKVVWHIFPAREQVHVYQGKNLSQMLVCIGDASCSAAPVLPDFVMTAGQIFQKPPKPA